MWLADKGCGEVVEGVWQASVGGAEDTIVLRKIATCGKELTRWRVCLDRTYFAETENLLLKSL